MSTDSNILLPEGDTVTVCSGMTNGTSYHTRECWAVNQMGHTREVDIAVAHWKGLSECKRCRQYGDEKAETDRCAHCETDIEMGEFCESCHELVERRRARR